MCKNEVRKKTLVGKLKFWVVGLSLSLFIVGVILPNVISNERGCGVPDFTCSKMTSIKRTLLMFKLDNGSYPLSNEGLDALIKNSNPKKYLNYSRDAYMKKLPLDSWKNPFIYIHYQTDEGDRFQIISFGADGKYGGEGENADIIYPPCHKNVK